MKQILYFLIGFLISTCLISYTYASCTHDQYQTAIETEPYRPGWITAVPKTYGFGYTTSSTAQAAANAYRTANYPSDSVGSVTLMFTCNDPDSIGGYWYVTDYSSRVKIFVYDPSYVAPVIDFDGDGLPDDCDVYPDDPTPYKVKIYSYQTTDNSSAGTKTYQWMNTDRGQNYDVGTKDTNKTDWLAGFSTPWEDPPSDCTGVNTTPSSAEPVIHETEFTIEKPTGLPTIPNSDPVFQPGTSGTGAETGDDLQKVILENTSKTASNTDRMGDYFIELTKAVQNMDRNVSKIAGSTGSGTTATEEPGTALTAEDIAQKISDKWGDGTGDQTSLNAVDPMSQGVSDINGTLTEGTDYDAPIPLKEENFITDFLANSPIGLILTGSGFQTTGSSCSISFSLRGKTHILSLCEFQSGFQAAGNFLFAFCGLIGLIHLISGRNI